jgi:alpha-tubulin suppressor-like RCC1 family protein
VSSVFVLMQVFVGKGDRSRKWRRLLWAGLLTALVLASVVSASASESSGAAAWGLNADGQLGNGTTTTEKEAAVVKVLTEAAAVAGGELHSLALLKTGKVMAWGYNNDGQLGNNTTTTEKEPVEVKTITEAVAVAAGADHSLALLKTGKVMAWGLNSDGQLGNGTTTTEKEPVEVKGISEAVAIAAGSDYSLAVLKTGKVMAWGYNNDGQLGNNTTTTEKEPVEVKKITEAVAVAGGEFHSLVLLKSGKVMAWGDNVDGQLGNGTTATEKEPVEVKGLSGAVGGISAGANFSLASYATKPANTELPTVSGEAKDEKTLTAATGTWTGTSPITYRYQWESCNAAGESCASISGAASASYPIAHEQVGDTIRLEVTAQNSAGEATARSAQTGIVVASVPANKEKPVISGKAEVGQLLTVSNGTWTGTPAVKYTYQWESCVSKSCKAITGATESSYRVTSAQLGDTLQAVVSDENSAGKASAASTETSAVTAGPPVNIALPVVSGTAQEGGTLSASTGSWVGTEPFSYAYQWQKCNSGGESCSSIGGATSATYELTASNVGGTVRVEVTAKNLVEATRAFSALTSVVASSPPENTLPPAISGMAKSGQLLTVSNGSWEGAPPMSYGYQWESCNSKGESCSTISGATASSYRLLNSQVSDTLRAMVTASNSAGSVKATSAATASVTTGPASDIELPTISGKAEEGEVLSASTGVWGGGEPFTYTYQWESCTSEEDDCSPVSGATSSTFSLTASYVGRTLRVIVAAKNSIGASEATSSASAVVIVPDAPANTASPTIAGTARDGQTLTASTGTWSGTASISYAYQWQSCNLEQGECQNIEAATGQTYTLTTANLETTVRIVVTATNSIGTARASSGASAEIEPGAPSEFEAPSIAGDPNAYETLNADAGVWGGTETLVGYQWERCNATGGECTDISGATESTYEIEEEEVGETLRVRVGVSNVLGSVTATSPATEVIGGSTHLSDTLAPSITGTPRSAQTLTANDGSWLGETAISYGYQWESCNSNGGACKDIEGATAATYVLGSGSVGDTLRVRVGVSETGGTVSRTSAATAPIAPERDPTVESLPAVSGTGLKGDLLTATNGAWSGLVGSVAYTYQWERCGEIGEGCSTISGATGSTYTLTETDVGSTLRVLVTATDESGTTTAPSSATTVISRTTLVNVALPSITGTDEIGQTLTADGGIWTGEGDLTYAYTWERCNEKGEGCSAITGASEPSYTPSSSDVGKTLKVIVTAEGTAGKESLASALTPVIESGFLAPTDLFAPAIEGNLTPGETLTAQKGTWVSSEPISYTYQWQQCNDEGESCSNITAATSSTYKLVEGDVNATLRVLVTGENSIGSTSATSEASETVEAAGAPKNTSSPVITGTEKLGERLTASNGSWSGSRPLAYHYRWERCNTAGESCTAIEGATKPSYTAASADVGSTLRVNVTAANSLGSAGAISTQTIVIAGSGTSVTSAIELAETTDPSVLQPATSDTIEGQEIKPAVADSGEWLTGTTTLTSSSTSKETPGEFAVNTPAGELSFQPIASAATAAQTPTIVNGSAALFAGTSNATDMIIRPDALGTSTLLQLHSPEAPTSFSWEVGLGPNQRLEKLSNGDIAVLEIPATSPLEGSLGEPLGGESSEATAEDEGAEANSEAAENALEEGISDESPLEKLPAAPTASTPLVEPKSGELHPQETKTLYENDNSAVTYAEEHTTDTTLMVIQTPKVMDAKGNTVTASLSIENEIIKLTISPSGGTTYPVTAETNIAAPTNEASEAKAHNVRYGLSDPKASSFETAEEEPGTTEAAFDSHLKNGQLHVGIARDVIPYNWHASNPELDKWLEAVHVAGLQPYITFTVEDDQFCHRGLPCKETGLGSYQAHVKELIAGLMKLHAEKPSIPAVTLYGAWNEPDLNKPGKQDPLYKNAKRAALFWKDARAILRQVGCNCTMVAGEFSEDDGYINNYLTTIQKNHSLWPGKPHIWGFHDYEDLEHYYAHPYNSYAEAFIKKIKRLGASRVWFSEQGVMLQNGGTATKLDDSSQAEDAKRQRDAAKDFLKLGDVHLAKEVSRVELVDYYLYKGPSAEVLTEPGHKHEFDSALLPGAGVTAEEGHPAENPRQAYCVLALGLEDCPAASTTKAAITSTITASAATVDLTVNPEGATTKYMVEYGVSNVYGKTTTAATVGNENGEQSETAALSGLEACTTYHYEAVAENTANEEEKQPGLGGDRTFVTSCVASSVTAGGSESCATSTTGRVLCWGDNYRGALGIGTAVGPETCDVGWSPDCSRTPVVTTGITEASQTAVDTFPNACAVLGGGEVKCWGAGIEGDLGNGTLTESEPTPTTVSELSTVTALGAGEGRICALLSGGSVSCWGGYPYYFDTPTAISGITTAVAISERCAVLSSGTIDCWGSNYLGSLGSGENENDLIWPETPVQVYGITNAKAVSISNFEGCALLTGGTVRCWGRNTAGQLGDGTSTGPEKCEGIAKVCSASPVAVEGITNATAVSVGDEDACALLSTGSIDCWGNNEYGQLGDGTTNESVDTPTQVHGITDATEISVGPGYDACALLTGGGVECWGENELGQLGNGTTNNAATPTPVTGFE